MFYDINKLWKIQTIQNSLPVLDKSILLRYSYNMANLTPKQAMFVIEYLKDLNGAQAAIRAGYSEDSAKEIASENLTKPNIISAIEQQMEARARRTLITADRIIADIDRVAQRCMQAEPVMIFNKVIQKWEQLKDDKGDPVYQFDSAGANKALENLARNQKLLTDKTELGNADGSNLELGGIIEIFVESPDIGKNKAQELNEKINDNVSAQIPPNSEEQKTV